MWRNNNSSIALCKQITRAAVGVGVEGGQHQQKKRVFINSVSLTGLPVSLHFPTRAYLVADRIAL